MKHQIVCPHCGRTVATYRNPLPTVDIILETEGGLILVKRKNPPAGWALPGGFVDYGESLEAAAVREAKEETSLDVELVRQFGAYSDPARDPRHHTVTVVFIGRTRGKPLAGDDAGEIGIFTRDNLPADLAFDHSEILKDYYSGQDRMRGRN